MEYQMEALGRGVVACVTRNHRFGTDAFLLAAYAQASPRDVACDLGTGCGIIPLLWLKEKPPREVWAVDIQKQAISQLEAALEYIGPKGCIKPLCADLRELDLPAAYFDLVTCNPPYKVLGAGLLSELESERIARHEVLCTIVEVCQAAARLLRVGGRLCLCQRPERLLDTLEAMRQAGVEPKQVRFVQKRGDTAPWLFLVRGKRGARPGLRVEKPLLIQGEGRDGFSRELLDIYGEDKV